MAKAGIAITAGMTELGIAAGPGAPTGSAARRRDQGGWSATGMGAGRADSPIGTDWEIPTWADAVGIRAAVRPSPIEAPASTEAHLRPSLRRSRWLTEALVLGENESGEAGAAGTDKTGSCPGQVALAHRASLEMVNAIVESPVFHVPVNRALRQARMTKSAPYDHSLSGSFSVIHRLVIHRQVDKTHTDGALLALVVVEC